MAELEKEEIKRVSKGRNKGLPGRIWRNRWGYLFLLPLFLIMGIFKYYPTFTAIIKSFYEWNGFNVSKFIGLDNYIALMHDKVYLVSMKNVGLIALASIAKTLIFPLLAAELICRIRARKMKDVYKYLFVIPMVVPAIVIILMWRWIYNPSYGALNQFLELLGFRMGNHAWLGSASTSLLSVILTGFPWIGGTAFLVILGGLQSISGDLYEAAVMDGAGPLQQFFRIDLPLVFPQLRLVLITTIIDALGSFENVMVLTGGGPGDYSMVPALHMYQQGMTYYKMGYACAVGMSIFFIVLLFTLLSFRVKRRDI